MVAFLIRIIRKNNNNNKKTGEPGNAIAQTVNYIEQYKPYRWHKQFNFASDMGSQWLEVRQPDRRASTTSCAEPYT